MFSPTECFSAAGMITPGSIYSLLSALMVHIYHLHIQTEVASQQQSIVACMDALERLSGLWLVGKMVHDLFEAILGLDGLENPLKNQNLNLPCNTSNNTKVEFNDNSAPDLQAAENGIKSLSLTPSLIAHMDASLKSASSPNKLEVRHTSSNGRGFDKTSNERHKRSQDVRPLAPRTKDSGEYASSGTGYKFPSTSNTTGLNAAEWLVGPTFVYLKPGGCHALPDFFV